MKESTTYRLIKMHRDFYDAGQKPFKDFLELSNIMLRLLIVDDNILEYSFTKERVEHVVGGKIYSFTVKWRDEYKVNCELCFAYCEDEIGEGN